MYIMLVNDDGIESPGIWALHDALSGEHEVIVCAPHSQCSGFSHSISIAGSLRAQRYARGGAEAYEIYGTPADCALLGLNALCARTPDLVISGINDGYNSGMDVHYSGTIGAAIEARLHGVPALAVSTRLGNREFGRTIDMARRVMAMALDDQTGVHVYSLNVPEGELKGLRRAPLAGRFADTLYSRVQRDDGQIEFSVRHAYFAPNAPVPRNDRELLARGYATYTVLRCDWTEPECARE